MTPAPGALVRVDSADPESQVGRVAVGKWIKTASDGWHVLTLTAWTYGTFRNVVTGYPPGTEYWVKGELTVIEGQR